MIAEKDCHSRFIDSSRRHPICEFVERVGLRIEVLTVETKKHQGTHECRALVSIDEWVISGNVKEIRGGHFEYVAV